MMGIMVQDVLEETERRLAILKPKTPDDIRNAMENMAAFSDILRPQVAAVKAFLFENVYRHAQVMRVRHKMSRVVKDLFDAFFNDPGCLPMEWQEKLSAESAGPAGKTRIVLDYVAGMTDRFALLEHQRLFDPYAIEGLPSV
jgi:dGTPase